VTSTYILHLSLCRRYTSTISLNADRPKHNYRNATDLNAMLDDLRPDTEYEFTVKVVKGRRQSPWSLVVLNSTQEAAPDSPPRDLSVIPDGDTAGETEAGTVTLTWLPPRRPNGRINGYVIFYTVDKRKQDREWVVEGVVGDKTAAEIRSLEPDTRYYFKIQARNSKGYGPHSPVVMYRTKSSSGGGSGGELVATNSGGAGGGGIPPAVQYAVFASGGAIVLLAVIFGLVMCRRGNRALSAAAAAVDERTATTKPYLKSEKNAALREKLNPPPPDLWINHDQLELRSMDSNQGEEGGGRAPSLPRSTPVDHRGSTSTLDRSRYITPYSGEEGIAEMFFGFSFCRACSSFFGSLFLIFIIIITFIIVCVYCCSLSLPL
jgi:neogenin